MQKALCVLHFCLVFILSVFCCVSAFCAGFTQIDNSFPFYNFGFDKNSKISAFNLNTPITLENDRILVSDDGHLKANNQRIRIFGTNLSNITDRDMAPVYAERCATLHKFLCATMLRKNCLNR